MSKLFQYKGFVHWKLKLLSFLVDSFLNSLMLRNTLKKKAVPTEQFKKSLSYSEAVVTDKFQIKKCLAEFPTLWLYISFTMVL